MPNRRSPKKLERKLERLRLFGYYSDIYGNTINFQQLKENLQDLTRNRRPRHKIDLHTVVYHPPEAVTDHIISIGETYITKDGSYPALGLMPGEVLSDPKIRFKCPIL